MTDVSFETMVNKLQSLPVGIMQKKLQIKNRISDEKVVGSDIFDVGLQIAGKDVSWQLFYDRTMGSDQPPDVIFDSASTNFVPRTTSMKSLRI